MIAATGEAAYALKREDGTVQLDHCPVVALGPDPRADAARSPKLCAWAVFGAPWAEPVTAQRWDMDLIKLVVNDQDWFTALDYVEVMHAAYDAD